MTLHKITESYTESFSVVSNINLKFRTIAIVKTYAKQNNHSNKTCKSVMFYTIRLRLSKSNGS
jgi:hypothetical protein